MTLEDEDEVDFEELMSEAPGGSIHGRTRTESGWRDLETGETFSRSPALVTTPIQHGTLYAYTKLECRCLRCRGANAEYHRQRRRKTP